MSESCLNHSTACVCGHALKIGSVYSFLFYYLSLMTTRVSIYSYSINSHKSVISAADVNDWVLRVAGASSHNRESHLATRPKVRQLQLSPTKHNEMIFSITMYDLKIGKESCGSLPKRVKWQHSHKQPFLNRVTSIWTAWWSRLTRTSSIWFKSLLKEQRRVERELKLQCHERGTATKASTEEGSQEQVWET